MHYALHVVKRLQFLLGCLVSHDRRPDVNGGSELNLAAHRFDMCVIDKSLKFKKRTVICSEFVFFRAKHFSIKIKNNFKA